jgi:protein gp37
MAETTNIEWADATFNPWWGCVKVSPGCTNCYAENDARRYGYDVWGADKPRRYMSDDYWKQPLKWNENATQAGRRLRVFCASHADVFEDNANLNERLDEIRMRLFIMIKRTTNLDWLLLTKRPEMVRTVLGRVEQLALEEHTNFDGRHHSTRGTVFEWLKMWLHDFPPANVWLGTTVEDQKRTERIEELVRLPARVRWLSMEPLLEEVTLPKTVRRGAIDWIITGGESVGGRACDLNWQRKIVAHCQATGVKVFVKQLGSNAVTPAAAGGLVRIHTKHKKGGDIDEFPEDLRVRDFPPPREA